MTFDVSGVFIVISLRSVKKLFFATKDTKNSKKILGNFVCCNVRDLNFLLSWLVRIKSAALTVFAAALVVVCGACTHTRLTDTQVNDAHRGNPVSDVLIIMVTDDVELREPFEAGFVAQLKASGVDAVSSTDVIAAPSDQKMAKDVILDAVNAFQNDAVLISHMVDVEKYDIPDFAVAVSGGFYGYYNYAYDYVHAPGLYSTHTHKFVRLETSLYNIRDDSSMWSGRAESSIWHPKSEKRVIDDMIEVLIKDLKRNKLIP